MEKTRRRLFDTIVLLGALVLIAALIGAAYITDATDKAKKLENIYQKSLYDATETLGNIEVKLSKLMVATDAKAERMLAEDIWRQASCASDNLAQLPLDQSEISGTEAFVNRLGDYAYSLTKRLNAGEKLAEKDEEQLESLYGRCRKLHGELNDLSSKVGKGWRISDHMGRDPLGKGRDNRVGDTFSELEKASVDYPKLIYDGPFSEGVKEQKYKAIESAPEIGEEAAAERVRELLADLGVKSLKYRGSYGGKIENHEFDAACARADYNIELTAKGGLPLLIAADRHVGAATLTDGGAIEKAEEFIRERVGLKGMKGVWVNRSGSIACVNLAYVVGETVFYPDMIKVKVALDNGDIIGLESYAYVCSHAGRGAEPAAVLTEAAARAKVSKKLEIISVQKAVIPREHDRETLCYEFYCEYKDLQYIVYVNATTGAEEDVLRVIDQNQGNMII